jgi:hypothetical protein
MRYFIGCVMFMLCGQSEAGSVKLMLEPALIGKEVYMSGGINIHESVNQLLGVNVYAGVEADQMKTFSMQPTEMAEVKAVMGYEKISVQPGVRYFNKNQNVVGFIRLEYKL